MKHLIAIFLGLYFSSHSFAARCEWNSIRNRPDCCTIEQQAIWSPIQNTVKCVPSISGDSCAWSPISNGIKCCETHDHAVWNRIHNSIDCFKF